MSAPMSLQDIFPNLLRDDIDADRWHARGVREGFVSSKDSLVHAVKDARNGFVFAYCRQFDSEYVKLVRVFGVVAGHKVCRECVREIEAGIARA